MCSDDELRINHEFVVAFETLRKMAGHREMDDIALRDVAALRGVSYETMRVARHLRNALAHADRVNRENLLRHHRILTDAVQGVAPTTHGHSRVGPGVDGAVARQSERKPDAGVSGRPERAYRIHAWGDSRLEDEMIANGFVSIGGAEIGDLTDVNDPEAIRAKLTETMMPERSPVAIALFVGYWRRFLWESEVGDVVALPRRNGTVAIGEFVGPYHHVTGVEHQARHRRTVSWDNTEVPRDLFGNDLAVTLKGRHTVQEFKAKDASRRLRALAAFGTDPGLPGRA